MWARRLQGEAYACLCDYPWPTLEQRERERERGREKSFKLYKCIILRHQGPEYSRGDEWRQWKLYHRCIPRTRGNDGVLVSDSERGRGRMLRPASGYQLEGILVTHRQ